MIRNLRILVLVAMALTAFGAVNASGASAAGELFHCEVDAGKFCKVTLDPDGSAKNSHHVFIVKKGAASGAATCGSLTGTVTAERTTKTATVVNLVYAGICELAGGPATITTTGCDYQFASEGGGVGIVCEAGKSITITSGACVVTVGSQALTGITYTNLNAEREVTASTNVKNIAGTAGAGCAGLVGFTGAFTEGEYTTGNTIATAFRDDSGAEGPRVNGWWT